MNRGSPPTPSGLVAAALAGALALALSLALPADASACVCASIPLAQRLDDADAAVVGRVRGYANSGSDVSQRVLTFDVDTRVKGDVEGQVAGIEARRILVRVPLGTDCDVTIEPGTTTGLLLTRLPTGGWYATACSVVDAGRLVAAGGEPRGTAVKVAIGLAILALVLLWSLRRLKKGTRPHLPGAPGP